MFHIGTKSPDSIASDHKILIAKIKWRLHKQDKLISRGIRRNWSNQQNDENALINCINNITC